MKKLLTLLLLLTSISSFSQGRIVINEFMPWTANTCGAPTSEFVELLNFGPGPVNIGGYILTDGDYAITIPANTIVQPGEFYVISGQTVIPAPCANIDSSITANLNWNTCNCTSGTIPSTGDGFLTDGGMASEQVVLLAPDLTVADAVVRKLPAESSSLITTSTVGGQFAPKIFNLSLMSITYEEIGESAGRANSFARKLDGDCGWEKDPQQSGHATNNTHGGVSDVSYSFGITNALDCALNGSVSIAINGTNVASLFPMNYILGYDTDNDNIFELTDSYINGIAVAPSIIPVAGLTAGNYRVTVASVLGCDLKTIPFTILTCNGNILPVHFLSFAADRKGTTIECQWSIENTGELDQLIIEKSTDGRTFTNAQTITSQKNTGTWNASSSFTENSFSYEYFRLKLISKTGQETFSSITHIAISHAGNAIWPNPVKDLLYIQLKFTRNENITYSIFNLQNQLIAKGQKPVYAGSNVFSIPAANLAPGSYQLLIQSGDARFAMPVRMRFLKL
jgi:hypothetical protein